MNERAKTGFYKTNIKVLNFKIDKDMERILFNHYIMQKENYQRLKSELPHGQFHLAIHSVEKDLNISYAKAQRLINEFIALGIIERVFKGVRGSKKASIYQYNSYSKSDNDNDNDSDNDKPSIFKGLKGASDNESDNESDNSKKELIKKKYIYSANVEELWNLYPNKKGKAQAVKKIPKLIKLHGKEQLTRCIERYSREVMGKDKDYILNGSTFFNGRYEDYLDTNYKEQKDHENKFVFKPEDYIEG
jgi:predicted transcriptional regulator